MFCLFQDNIWLQVKFKYTLATAMFDSPSHNQLHLLPPGLQGLSSHTFGELCISIRCSDVRVRAYQPHFLGAQESGSSAVALEYRARIMVSLWHFYTYLSDCSELPISIITHQLEPQTIKIPLSLKPIKEVFRPEYTTGCILSQNKYECYLENNSKVTVFIKTQFEEDIHMRIRQIVDWKDFIVFENISPISSGVDVSRQQQLDFQTERRMQNATPDRKNSRKESKGLGLRQQTEQSLFHPMESSIQQDVNNEEQSRMLLEEDIDRIINEMQSKPYDCNRYQNNEKTHKTPPKQENIRRNATAQNFYPQTQEKQVSNQVFNQTSQGNFKSSNKLGQNTTQAYSQHQSHHFNSLEHRNQTVIQSSLGKPPRSSSKSKNRSASGSARTPPHSTHSLKNTLQTNANPLSATSSCLSNLNSSAYLELKINELLITGQDMTDSQHENQYIVKVFTNEDGEQFFSAQGIRQGENIIFEQKLKVRNLSQINHLKFALFDDYGTLHGQGIFVLSRISTVSRKGTFMVSILPATNISNTTIRSKSSNLTPMLHVPVHRTLRIQAEIIEKIEVVQMFMKISEVSPPSSCIRYRVPFTKETIQFSPSIDSDQREHINIFPHSLANSDKILIEVWRDGDLLGQVEVALKNLKSMNVGVINASTSDPIYLCDGPRQIRNILGDGRPVGRMRITLCCGTVRHMQRLLQQVGKGRQLQNKKKTQVSLDTRLGVLVQEKKNVAEACIQAEISEGQSEQEPRANIPQPKNSIIVNADPDTSLASYRSTNQFLEDPHCLQFNYLGQTDLPKESQRSDNSNRIQNRSLLKSLPSLTDKVYQSLTLTLTPLLPLLTDIKTKCRPHLLYNFIQLPALISSLKQCGVKEFDIQCVVEDVLLNSQVINMNIFYDLCEGLQNRHQTNASLISDQILALQGLKHFYSDEKLRRKLNFCVDSSMDFSQMRQQFGIIDIKLTLSEYHSIIKFMNNNNYKAEEGGIRLKQHICEDIDRRLQQVVQQGFYEQDIVDKIYGDHSHSQSDLDSSYHSALESVHNETAHANLSSASLRFNMEAQKETKQFRKVPAEEPKPYQKTQYIAEYVQPKQQSRIQENNSFQKVMPQTSYQATHLVKFTVEGISNVKQSAECLFDISMKSAYIRVMVESPTFEEIIFRDEDTTQELSIEMEIQDADGRVELCLQGKVMASAAFSLIKNVKSVYAMKSREGEFSGLLHLTVC